MILAALTVVAVNVAHENCAAVKLLGCLLLCSAVVIFAILIFAAVICQVPDPMLHPTLALKRGPGG